ncbi:MAG: zinc-binding dehydrogenase [Acidimicrobiia bacterium]|nr:zinc-binding dehydrogenase [Acidimicrobiia bacterium]
MSEASSGEGRGLRSTVTTEGEVVLSIEPFEVDPPVSDEVLIRIEASPINPSDLGVLLAGADVTTATADDGSVRLKLSPGAQAAVQARVGKAMPVGNEGAGVVVAGGDSPLAQSLVGRTVAALAGGMYGTHRTVKADQCLVLAEGTAPIDAASCFVNPLTALGMTETMRREDHTGLVHTAAASNLGQMLNRICQADGIPLVNIVRRREHVDLLRAQGAEHVVDSSSASFVDDLTTALIETGATIAFDAIGGGELASTILQSMEAAATANGGEYNRYGSTTHKQVYIYGGLDRGPTIVNRAFGMAWAIGGWLLPPFLAEIGPDRAEQLRQRVAHELTRTFASSYTATISLDEVLDLDRLRAYARMATGEKVLVTPQA